MVQAVRGLSLRRMQDAGAAEPMLGMPPQESVPTTHLQGSIPGGSPFQHQIFGFHLVSHSYGDGEKDTGGGGCGGKIQRSIQEADRGSGGICL